MLLALLVDPGPRATPHPPKHRVFLTFAFIIVCILIFFLNFFTLHSFLDYEQSSLLRYK